MSTDPNNANMLSCTPLNYLSHFTLGNSSGACRFGHTTVANHLRYAYNG